MTLLRTHINQGSFSGHSRRVFIDELKAAITDREHLLHQASKLIIAGDIEQAGSEILRVLQSDLPDGHSLQAPAVMLKLYLFQGSVDEAKEIFLREDISIDDLAEITKNIHPVIQNYGAIEAENTRRQRRVAKKPRPKKTLTIATAFQAEMTRFRQKGRTLKEFIREVQNGKVSRLSLSRRPPDTLKSYMAGCANLESKTVSGKTLENWWVEAGKTKNPD